MGLKNSKVVHEVVRVTKREVTADGLQHVVVDGLGITVVSPTDENFIADFGSEKELAKANNGTPYSAVLSVFAVCGKAADGSVLHEEKQQVHPFVSLSAAKEFVRMFRAVGTDIIGDCHIVENGETTATEDEIVRGLAKRVANLATQDLGRRRDAGADAREICAIARIMDKLGNKDAAEHSVFIAELMEDAMFGCKREKWSMDVSEEIDHAVNDLLGFTDCE